MSANERKHNETNLEHRVRVLEEKIAKMVELLDQTFAGQITKLSTEIEKIDENNVE